MAPPPSATATIAESAGRIALISSETFEANGVERTNSAPVALDRDDSHYELPVSIDVDIKDSQVELPAFILQRDSPNDELPDDESPDADELPSVELMLSGPWYYHFVDSWGRYHFAVAIGFGALSLVVLGFFLARAILGGQTMSASVTLLIVGCVGMIAFILLSVTVTTLNLLLADLAKNLRQMRIRSEPNTRIVGE